MLQMLSGFCSESKLILGHVDIAEKTNEIPTAQQLIKELGLPEGTIYTMDAMHCQKKPSKQLRKQKVS
jgi:predicted transposase YbfD/YdcC